MTSTPSPTAFRDRADEIHVALHACCPIHRPPTEAQLHGLVALGLVAARFRGQLVEPDAIETAGVDGNSCLGPASEQTVHRLLRRLPENVPQSNIDGADGSHPDALAAESHRLAIHMLPEKFDVPWVGTNQKRLEIQIDYLLGGLRSEGRISDSDVAVIRKNFHD